MGLSEGCYVILGSNKLQIGTSTSSNDGGGTFAGKITGSGSIIKNSTQTLTLTGENTYTGYTRIDAGKLVLGSGGKIEKSAEVSFDSPNTKLEITGGTKKIKMLSSPYTADCEVILGSNLLIIGTEPVSDDGGGYFQGIFSGIGGRVTKQGTGTFTMSGSNAATGTFTVAGGTLKFSNIWAGNFIQSPNSTVDVIEDAYVGGTLTLKGGAMNMNLTTTPPSKITATGYFSAEGITTLNIASSGTTSNHTIILAASGIWNNTTNFQLNMPGTIANLTAKQ